MLVMLAQYKNTPTPMLVTPSGIVTHQLNAIGKRAVTDSRHIFTVISRWYNYIDHLYRSIYFYLVRIVAKETIFNRFVGLLYELIVGTIDTAIISPNNLSATISANPVKIPTVRLLFTLTIDSQIAIIKRRSTDTCYALRDYYTRQPDAERKRATADTFNAARDIYVR